MSNDKTITVQSAAQALIDYIDSKPLKFTDQGKDGYNLKEDLKVALQEEKKTTNITIQFGNEKAAEYFCEWLCNSGEQQYFECMEYREQEEEDGDITVLEFNYHGKEDKTKAQNDPERYGGFMCDNTIRTECGRLDEDE